jgi:hypothetical protein
MKNLLTEADYAINQSQYEMLMGGYKNGNYPKEFVNEGAAQIQKLSIALAQHKEDVFDGELMNNLMALDIKNMREKFIRYSESTSCATAQLICSLVIIDLDKILRAQEIDLNTLLKP